MTGNATAIEDDAGPLTSLWARWKPRLAGLFPAAEPSKTPRARVVAGYSAAFLAAVAYLLLIPAGRTRLNHLWAEDGARFLLDARTKSFGANLVSPYEGYLHMVPRLASEVIGLFPLSWAAVGIAVTAAMLRAVVALFVFASSGGLVRSRVARFALAALVVVAPAGNSESLGNLANFHWFALYGAFWLLWWRPAKRWQSVVVAIALFLAVTTSAVGLLLAPIAVARFALAGRRQALITAGFWAGTVVQLVALLLAQRDPYFAEPIDVFGVATGALMRVPLVAFSNSEDVARIYSLFGYWPAVLTLLFALALAAVAIRWSGTPRRVLVVAAIAYGALFIALDLGRNWHTGLYVDRPGVVIDGQRYSSAPVLFLLTVVVIGLDQIPKAAWRRIGAVAVAAVLLTGIVRQLPKSAYPLTGTPWDQSVADAKLQCAQGKPTARVVEDPAGWFLTLPCDDVN
ncbi:MAG: hypothetical protein JWQ81_260 [Amycolatopsis sp.]|jgi:hypothetical protein|uniref:hypothetical protein n=1 Tax=Amycolatopsis sp. TaxID=37632 RepID=UPI00262DCCEF|nr:hypothetical protein [Amycolatopsis sp.]MCU1679521.1 hypothetical protein [Amycolatopsis sp.]